MGIGNGMYPGTPVLFYVVGYLLHTDAGFSDTGNKEIKCINESQCFVDLYYQSCPLPNYIMSLFDNLKYQNIDLGNRLELETLPEELIALYWDVAHSEHPEERGSWDHKKTCRILAQWGNSAESSDSYARKTFIRALSKYNQ